MGYDDGIELKHRRTANSKHYWHGSDNFTMVASKQPMHWEDEDGNLHDVDCSIIDGRVDKTFYKAELLTDKIGYRVYARKDNSKIDMILDKIDGVYIPYTIYTTISGNKAIWEDITPDLDVMIEFVDRNILVWRRIKSDKAAREVEFIVREDDEEERKAVASSKAFGYDADGKVVKATAEITNEKNEDGIHSYTLKERWTGEVVVLDEKTRVKSLSQDVSYPVLLK